VIGVALPNIRLGEVLVTSLISVRAWRREILGMRVGRRITALRLTTPWS
jgi:hypothetical protein